MLAILIAGGLPATASAKTYKAECAKGANLQKIIDSTVSGDAIEISGICMGNILIRDKALTLTGKGPGPNGITGTAAETDGVRIENSRGTQIEGLVISNPLFTSVRIRYQSDVTMTDCTISNTADGAGTAIWTQDNSFFAGRRLRLDNNLRGLGAADGSRVSCRECDLNGNVNWAASAWDHSQLTLLDSEVNGNRGIEANRYSYIDFDCASYDYAHPCVLHANKVAGQAYAASTAAFLETDFHGWFSAGDRSAVQVAGARQLSNPGGNWIDDNSSLRVEPYDGDSQSIVGHTQIFGFSNAQFHGDGTVLLDGSLECHQGGDAFVDDGVDLTNFTITGCDHAP